MGWLRGLDNWRDETKAALLERVRLAGIAGLAGRFPHRDKTCLR